MALQKQLASIDFTKGIDKRTDIRLTVPGTLRALQNCCFTEGGTIRKRPGSTALTTSIVGGGTISAGDALRTVRDELLRVSSSSLCSYTSGGWVLRGAANDATFALARKSVVQPPAAISAGARDICVNGTVGCALFDWSGSLRATVYDTSTGVAYQTATELSTGVVNAQCVAVDSSILVFYTYNNAGVYELRVRILASVSSPAAAFGAALVLRTDVDTLNGNQRLRAIPHGSNALVSYCTGPEAFTLLQVSAAGAVSASPAPISITHSAAGAGNNTQALGRDATRIYVVSANSARIEARIYNHSFVLQAGPLTLESANADGAVALGTVDGSTWTCLFNSSSNTIRRATFNSTAVVSAGAAFMRGAGIVGDIGVYSGRGYALVRYVSGASEPIQSVLWAVDTSAGEPLARLLANSSPNTSSVIPPRAIVSGANVDWLAHETGRLAFQDGNVASTTGVTRSGIAITAAGSIQSAELGGSLYFAAARPLVYDGRALYEAGFEVFPENISNSATGAGSLSAGTYQFVAVYEWFDAQGNFERSARSAPLSVTATAGQSKTITIPTLRATRKTSTNGGAVVIHLFATEANGTVFYRSSSVTAPTANNTGTDSVTITHSMADTTLIGNEALSTALLDAGPWPECKAIHVHQDRLFVARAEDPTAFAYSTKKTDGNAPLFNEELTGRIPATHGDLTAFATLDDKLILFAERGVYALTGDGPDAAGLGGSFSEPQDLNAGCGAVDWRSIVSTPLGVFFFDGTRIQLLGRDLSITPIGEGIDSQATGIQRAVYVPSLRQVRFTDSTGYVWVFDLRYGQWSRYQYTAAAVDACLYDGRFTQVAASGAVLRDAIYSESVWEDAGGSPLSVIVESGTISLAGVQGFQRVYEMLFVRRETGAAQATPLTLSVLPNADPETTAYSESASITAAGAQFRYRPAVQKCQSFAFKLSASTTGDFTLTNLTLELGIKSGGYKGLSSGNSF